MNKYNFILRIAILCTPFVLPWWFVILIGLAALFWFDKYWDFVVIGIFLDSMYATTHTIVGSYAFTITSLLLFWVSIYIKQRLIVY